MMRPPTAVLILLSVGLPSALSGQAVADSAQAPLRIATITAGIGNAMGWFGLQGERYFSGDRLSAFLGVGYTPKIDEPDPSGITFAAGFRGFTPGIKHRGFLEASACQVLTVTSLVEESSRLYGPCLQAGYQFASRGGFTAMVSLGVGYALGDLPEGASAAEGLLGLGLGYTWRRR
jgi:hypothetical protein